MTFPHRTRFLAFSGLLLALGPQHALAQDANALGERIKSTFAKQNIVLNWSGIQQDGSKIVLQGVTAGLGNAPAANPIGDVTLENVTEENGGYKIGTVSFPGYSVNENGIAFDMSGAKMSGLSIPAEGSTDLLSSMIMYESANLESVTVKQADKDLFTLSDLHFELTPPKDGQAMSFSGAAEKFTADLSSIPDPQTQAVLNGLGYSTINGFLELAGSWQPSDGRLQLSQYDISVEDVGTLGMTFDLGGYTPAFITSLQDMQKRMAASPPGSDNSAQGLAMLGLMQQITFTGASVRFDDDSLTSRVLDFFAKQQNVKPEDLRNQVKAIMPFLTAQLNNPALNEQIVKAVNTFLDDPESIEISAAPAAPVPFAQLAAGGMANPIELTKTLGLTVTANQGGDDDADDDGTDDGEDGDDAGDANTGNAQ